MIHYRRHKKENYTHIDNHVFRDHSLSLKAKGLLTQIYSLPDNWEYSVKGLATLFSDGKDAVNNALQELIEHGYIVRSQRTNKLGKFDGYEYDIYETPQIQNADNPITENPFTENPSTDNPITEKSPQLNTNIINTKEENTKVLNTENKKKERKKEMTFDEILDSVSVVAENPDLRETFIDFIKMRKLIKHPLTDRALKGIIKDTYKLGKGDPQQMILILEQSIKASWQGVFPLREEQKPTAPYKSVEQPRSYNPFTELKREEGMI